MWFLPVYLNGMVVGEVEELWDVMAIAKYPTLQSFIDMVASPEYLEAYHHRTCWLEGAIKYCQYAGDLELILLNK